MEENVHIAAEPRIPGTGLTYSQWRNLERSLNDSLSERFSKVWLEVSASRTVCITLFPITLTRPWGLPNYTIVTARNVSDFSLENILRIISERLQ